MFVDALVQQLKEIAHNCSTNKMSSNGAQRWKNQILIRCVNGTNVAEVVDALDEPVPIFQGPLQGMTEFEFIRMSYVDSTVITFLNQRLPRSPEIIVHFETNSSENPRSWIIIRQKIWPLLKANVCCLYLDDVQFDCLRLSSLPILRECSNLHVVYFDAVLQFPADDSADASGAQAVSKWLLTPRADGLPKVLRCRLDKDAVVGLREAFLTASQPAHFLIRTISSYPGIERFANLKHLMTGDLFKLMLYEGNWLLVCCPISRDEAKWANWEKETIKWIWDYKVNGNIYIDFKDKDIGKGMVDEDDDGPSEPKKPKK